MAPPGRMVNVGLVSPPLFVSLSSCRWSAANTPAAAPFVRQFSLAWPAFTFPLSPLGLSALSWRQLPSNDSALAINHPQTPGGRGGGFKKISSLSVKNGYVHATWYQNASKVSRIGATVQERTLDAPILHALTRDDGQIQFEEGAIKKAVRSFRRTLNFIRNTTSPSVMKQFIIRSLPFLSAQLTDAIWFCLSSHAD